jgi:hypothetical protein
MLQLQEVSVSQLMIDDQQRQAQLVGVLDRALEEYFTDDNRDAAGQLLMDTAHLLACQRREQDAGLTRAAADVFQLPTERLLVHPFARRFLERLIQMASPQQPAEGPAEEPQEEERRTEGGLILPTGIDR